MFSFLYVQREHVKTKLILKYNIFLEKYHCNHHISFALYAIIKISMRKSFQKNISKLSGIKMKIKLGKQEQLI